MTKKFIHPRFCKHPKVRYIYKDPLIKIGICYQCRTRLGQTRIELPILNKLIVAYGEWKMCKVFKDKITWYKADEF